MTPPTQDELQRGYDQIIQDGPNADITIALGMLVLKNPLLAEILERMTKAAFIMTSGGEPLGVRAALMGAYISGLHLGLHIGEARNDK